MDRLDTPAKPLPAGEWPPNFFERTAGCLSDDPIRRWPQEALERGEVKATQQSQAEAADREEPLEGVDAI